MSYGLINHISESNNANINKRTSAVYIFSTTKHYNSCNTKQYITNDVDDDDLLKTLLLGLHATTSNVRKSNDEWASYVSGYNLSGHCPGCARKAVGRHENSHHASRHRYNCHQEPPQHKSEPLDPTSSC